MSITATALKTRARPEHEFFYGPSVSKLKANTKVKQKVIYPDSDGKPMADNTIQYRWIVKIKENLELIFENNPNVFIAGDLLWYPIENNNIIRTAPDVMVVIGRPKGDRGSYRQWEEDDICPRVTFEILSPGNRAGEMEKKRKWYETYGVKEYYLYDPERVDLKCWIRAEDEFRPVNNIQGWISPELKIRFELHDELIIYRPDGQKFLTTLELDQLRKQEKQRADKAELGMKQEKQKVNKEKQQAEKEKQKAKKEKQKAEKEKQRADKAELRMKQEKQRADQIALERDQEKQRAEMLEKKIKALEALITP
ncbi:putative restriction endonuclease domain-containing protein [Candidatus Magnetomoraceae bacterium gMMP-13]